MFKNFLKALILLIFLISIDPVFSSAPPQYQSMEDNSHKVYVILGHPSIAPAVFDKLLPEENQRFQSAKTPDERYELGRKFAFEKFGLNLLQDERDRIAVSLFEASGTPTALGRLGYLYKEDRAGLDLQEGQRYTRAQELLERDNSPWALSSIGDMYCSGKFAHSGGRQYDIRRYPNYGKAAEYYRKSRDGYSWYKLGVLYSKGEIRDGLCCDEYYRCGGTPNRCFSKARELGYDVPREKEAPLGGFFLTDHCCLSCVTGLACLYIPCCIGYYHSNAIPEDRL